MKYFVFLAFFLIRLNCVGQDSTKNLSNHSISFTGGCNIIYPNINQYEIITNSSDFVITPEVSYNPWFDLSYNRLLHNYISSSFWLNFGIGFIENKYKAISNGYEYNDFGKYYISGVFNNEENVYALEGSLGLSVNNRIMKKIDWTNSIQMLFRYQVSSSFINFPGTNDLLPNEYYLYGYYLHLFYETGIKVQISHKLSLFPFISLPIINIGSLWEKNDLAYTFYKDMYPFNNFRSGIKITYNFIKK